MIIIYFVIAALLGAGGTGIYGYWKGYSVCNQASVIRELKAENKRLELSLKYEKQASEVATQQVEESNRIDNLNKDLILELQNEIMKVKDEKPNDNCVIEPDFLHKLNTIR